LVDVGVLDTLVDVGAFAYVSYKNID